jgi:hypothetical protein
LVSCNTIIIAVVVVVVAGHSGHAIEDMGLDRSDTGIVGSNPVQGMDVCQRLSVLCCPV